MGVPLVIAEPTARYRRELRRYRSTLSGDGACPTGGYCDAAVVIGEIGADEADTHGDNWPHDDPRWPAVCARCGCAFTPEDQWQRNDNRLYRLPDGTEFAWWGDVGKIAPPGTMVRAEWYDPLSPDGSESWMVILPDGGTWITTQSATGGGHWTVTGTAPAITVSPSIWHNQPSGWHGFIRNGELVSA